MADTSVHTPVSRHGVGESIASPSHAGDRSPYKIIAAASIGTVFEWYDFTLYGSLATVIAKKFFAGVDPTTGFIFALLTFGVGFIMRPFGAVVFGRVGDRIGRKKTFLVTVIIMGVATVGVGCLPGYDSIGIVAPIVLIGLRMLQGTALGGEYGGAATYVAEHSPKHRRGLNTSWISSTGTVGLLLSFAIVLLVRSFTGKSFDDWGWRIPFIFSLVLLLLSIRIRMNMHESPAFEQLRQSNTLSRAPLRETFFVWANIKRLLIALFAVCCGMSCVYYVAVLYPTFFLIQTLKVDPQQANIVVTLATLTCIPMFALAGWLCDKFGRKPVLLLGFLLTVLTLFPIFKTMTQYANPALAQAQISAPVVIETDPASCSFLFNPVGSRHFTSPCDIAKQALAAEGISYDIHPNSGVGGATTISVGNAHVASYDAKGLLPAEASDRGKQFTGSLRLALNANRYPSKADPAAFNGKIIFLLLIVLLFFMALTLVPTAPTLVEMFPTRIRYTAMSFPYHFASGWIGGLLPTFSFALSAQKGNIYFGLWYPIGWIIASFIVSLLFLHETKDVDLNADF